MNKNHKQISPYHNGFTLVELLVVISIISLLSSIIIVSTNSAKAKANDARTITEVRQVQTSLSLASQDGTVFPNPVPPGGSTDTYYCLGKSSGQSCTFWGATLSGSDILQAGLGSAFSGNIPSAKVTVNGQLFDGYAYKCKVVVNGICSGAVYWAQSANTPCSIGTEVMSDAGGRICGQDAGGIGTENVETNQNSGFDFDVLIPDAWANSNGVFAAQANLTSIQGTPVPVTLSYTQSLPPGMTITFPNGQCTPTCNQPIVITTSSTPRDTYSIQITATSQSGVEKTSTFIVHVIGGPIYP